MLVPVETTVIVRGERQKRTVYMQKSLTWSGHKLQGRTTFQGLNISIENRAGTYRRGIDPDGHEWKTKLHNDYGYIRGSVGVDGDHVDCFLGPDRDSRKAYIIHQVKPGTQTYDEDKVMLGFSGARDAKKAYLSNYDRSDMFGSMEIVTIDKLKTMLQQKKGKRLGKAIRIGKVPVGTIRKHADGWRQKTISGWKRVPINDGVRHDFLFGRPVMAIGTSIAPTGLTRKELMRWALGVFRNIGETTTEIGLVSFSRKSAESFAGHKPTSEDVATVPFIGKILSRSMLVRSPRETGRDGWILGAPVSIDGKPYIVYSVIVLADKSKRLKVHKTILLGIRKTRMAFKSPSNDEGASSGSHSLQSIHQEIASVKSTKNEGLRKSGGTKTVAHLRKSRRNGLVPVKTVVQRSDGKTYTTTVWKRPEDGQLEMFAPRNESSKSGETVVKRTRDAEYVAFDPPINGPGGKITGYEWAWTWGEVWSDKEEGLIPARVSDWERSTQSGDTKRQIVHQFHVETPDGLSHVMGAELASRTIGIAERSLRSKAKRAYERSKAQHDAKSRIEDLARNAVDKWMRTTEWHESVSALPDPGFTYRMGRHYENSLKAAKREDGKVAALPVADESTKEVIKETSRGLYGKNPGMAEKFKVSGWYHATIDEEMKRRGIRTFTYSAKEHRGAR